MNNSLPATTTTSTKETVRKTILEFIAQTGATGVYRWSTNVLTMKCVLELLTVVTLHPNTTMSRQELGDRAKRQSEGNFWSYGALTMLKRYKLLTYVDDPAHSLISVHIDASNWLKKIEKYAPGITTLRHDTFPSKTVTWELEFLPKSGGEPVKIPLLEGMDHYRMRKSISGFESVTATPVSITRDGIDTEITELTPQLKKEILLNLIETNGAALEAAWQAVTLK